MAKRLNLRHPDLMEQVGQLVESHYFSALVDRLRRGDGRVTVGETTVCMAREFGFCYGVERAIDMIYAARRHFPDREIHLIGEIIHNPDVNAQIQSMGVRFLSGPLKDSDAADLGPEDVVVIPAFGSEAALVEELEERGCQLVDTTCGDVMKVWRRVRTNARDKVTSIIHGKPGHEETQATASRAVGRDGAGHYLVVRDLDDAEVICRFIEGDLESGSVLERFAGFASANFDPARDLVRVGVANQTTMMKSETEAIQDRLARALEARDGDRRNFRVFDTICAATQDRQDALASLLAEAPDRLLVVGGYNSSNTTHLAELGEKSVPTWFIAGADSLAEDGSIRHWDLQAKAEVESSGWLPAGPATIAITAGASCPNNLIEDVLIRVFELRGVPPAAVRQVLVRE